MKKYIALSALLLSPALAAANEGKNYFSLSGEYIAGGSSNISAASSSFSLTGDMDYDSAVGLSGSAGRYITNNVRIDGELGYKNINADVVTSNGVTVDASDLDFKVISGMANITYLLPAQGNITPYVGGGLGWAYESEYEANAFAYQIRAGADYKLNDSSSIYGGYHYFGTTDLEYTENDATFGKVNYEYDINTHAIEIGFRRTF
jgi:opacity protein-like surface antigen